MAKNLQLINYRIGSFPSKLLLKGYECLYPFYKRRYPNSDCEYSCNAKQTCGDERVPGVSGYYRLYNEEDFLQASVESHLPFFDELILVHDCTTSDKTPTIAKALVEKYPNQVKYFFYAPAVYKSHTTAHKILPAYHSHSFINYYNYALSKTTRQVVTKVDGDHIAIDTAFANVAKNFHDMNFMDNVFYTFSGINLWSYHGELYVDGRTALTSVADPGFYRMRAEKCYYTKIRHYEDGYFSRKNREMKNAGVLFFHLKNMRSGIPYHSYRGLEDSVQQTRFKQRLMLAQRHWLDWTTFVRQYREVIIQQTKTDIAELPDPNYYLSKWMDKMPTIRLINDSVQVSKVSTKPNSSANPLRRHARNES